MHVDTPPCPHSWQDISTSTGELLVTNKELEIHFDLKENVFHKFPTVMGITTFSEENMWETF